MISNFTELEQKLCSEATTLLEQGKVECIVGYQKGSLKFTTSPLITGKKDDVDRLVINPFIVNNLAAFLIGLKGRIAIVAKGCDSRSIVSLIQDNKVSRDQVVIIGVPCTGMIDLGKVESLTGKDRDEIENISREDGEIKVTIDGSEVDLPVIQVLFDNCLGCEAPTPVEYDILLGDSVAAISQDDVGIQKIVELETMTADERWQFWKDTFSRCIRCYACRNICPVCFCERCFVEETEPQWILPAQKWQDNLIFQVIRNIHVAGRCTDCGECERACPVNIPLRSLSKKMYDLTGELFDFKAGIDINASPLMASYEANDVEDFIR
jgi:ferredoxin